MPKRFFRMSFYPFLFSIYPVIHLYVTNIAVIELATIWRSLIITIISSISLWYVIRTSFRFKSNHEIDLLTFIVLLLFFTYVPVRDGLIEGLQNIGIPTETTLAIVRDRFLLPLSCLVLLFGYWSISRFGEKLNVLTPFLNFVAITLIFLSLIPAILTVIQVNEQPQLSYQDISLHLSTTHPVPDIYYIVLDGYGRSDVLQECYEFDNSDFLDSLTDKGFFIANMSTSNYARTFLSLASSLNFEYLSYYEQPLIYGNMIKNNRVERVLKSVGYKIIRFSSGYQFTSISENADVSFGNSYLNDFEIAYRNNTLLDPFFDRQYLSGDEVLQVFEKLVTIPKITAPTFSFVHIVSPHPPYLFDHNGNLAPPSSRYDSNLWDRRFPNGNYGYIEQIIFLNNQIQKTVDSLLESSPSPPIIIIQSDHGPACHAQVDEIGETSQDWIRTRFPNLSIYYLPFGGGNLLYGKITPVNTFRIVFDYYFGTELGLLNDKKSWVEDDHFFYVEN